MHSSDSSSSTWPSGWFGDSAHFHSAAVDIGGGGIYIDTHKGYGAHTHPMIGGGGT